MTGFCKYGDGGIRTLVPVKANAFRVKLPKPNLAEFDGR